MGEYYRVSFLWGISYGGFLQWGCLKSSSRHGWPVHLVLKQAMVTTGDPPWLKKPPYDQGSSTIKGVLVEWCLLNSISLLHLFNYVWMTGHDYACQKELASWLWVEVISMWVVANSSIRLIFRLFFRTHWAILMQVVLYIRCLKWWCSAALVGFTPPFCLWDFP